MLIIMLTYDYAVFDAEGASRDELSLIVDDFGLLWKTRDVEFSRMKREKLPRNWLLSKTNLSFL